MRRSVSFVIALSMVLALIVAATAQSDVGRIQGIVRDASGAVLPGVEVRLMLGTNLVQRSVTDASGRLSSSRSHRGPTPSPLHSPDFTPRRSPRRLKLGRHAS